MVNALIVPVLVTTDLPPDTDLAAFAQVVADAVGALAGDSGTPYPGYLRGAAFWLDRPIALRASTDPAPATEQLRFAAMLGFLSTCGPRGSAKEVLADARTAIRAAVGGRYGDLGSPPAMLAITANDIRERTPESAVTAATEHAHPELAAATRLHI
ncbi:hypothetical protein GCM10022226_42090 [Sphaerisporangium flaviroseum]|uniref:Uncharacterized protein n=1 Tax=Sphaerisporangium flaviroseum TaxID=509199 RepID=A0ABP7IFC2_9ACTN